MCQSKGFPSLASTARLVNPRGRVEPADKQRAAGGKQRPNRRRFLHLLIRHIIHPVLGHRVSHGDVGVVRVHVRFEIRVHLLPLLECDAGKYTRHT